MESITVAERNKMSVKYGLITGVVYIILFSVTNLLMSNVIMYNVIRGLVYILYMGLIGVFVTQIKKADGGFIEFKDAFGAAFVMLLTAGILYYIYSYIYFQYLDPHYLEKMKTSVITYMETHKVPDESIDATAKKFDEQIIEAKTFHFGKTMLGFFGFLVMDSLFGMLVCLIVKKQRPMF